MSAGSSELKPRVVAVAGGRGGVGKSLLAANIGAFHATLGKRVVLVDGALGSANLHIFAGVPRPQRTLAEALTSEVAVEDLLVPTPVPGLKLLSGLHDPAWVASPEPLHVARLITLVREIDANVVVLDLPPGTADSILDLFLAADVGVLVAVPEPTSIELLYRFLRAAFMRRLEKVDLADALAALPFEPGESAAAIPSPLDLYMRALMQDIELASRLEEEVLHFTPHLVVNAVRSKADMEMGKAVASAARRHLGIPIVHLGHLEYDEAVWVAVRRRRPLLVEHPEARVSKCIEKVARRLIAGRDVDAHATSVLPSTSYYDLLEVAPTASFEDIRRANRRIREVYGRESVVMSGLVSDEELDQLHLEFDTAYTTLMDAAKRKDYDVALFPDGVPTKTGEKLPHGGHKADAPPVERPPMPPITAETIFTGPLIQQVREAKGIELREISERTKIGMAYLQAIEAENFRKLPAVVYVRGFLAEYARLLGLDRQRVLDTYLERYRAGRAELESQDDTLH